MPPEAMGADVFDPDPDTDDDPFGVLDDTSTGYDGRLWDVYSLGVLFYVVWTRQRPFLKLSACQILFAVSEEHAVPAPPWPKKGSTHNKPPKMINKLLQSMWSWDPLHRPNMAEVASTLLSIADASSYNAFPATEKGDIIVNANDSDSDPESSGEFVEMRQMALRQQSSANLQTTNSDNAVVFARTTNPLFRRQQSRP
jgi:hypothetical protein